MNKLILAAAALTMMASPAFAKDYTIKQISDPAGNKPYYFSPDNLTIQPGDTVNFIDAQDDMHDVMFVEVPKGVNEMIMSPMSEKEGDKFSYTFTVPGTYKFHCHPHEAKCALNYGAHSHGGGTHGGSHECVFREGAVSDPFAAELGEQAARCSIHATLNVLTHDKHALIATHLFPHRFIEGLG